MIAHWFDLLHTYMASHPSQGLLIAFLVAFSESLPIIGTIIPGSITMTVIGVFIGRELITGKDTLLIAALGAFIGDLIGYSCGYYFKDKVNQVWPFTRYPNWLNKSYTFFQKHGSKSVILGRFIGPARSSVPLVAGLFRMPMIKFIPTAAASAFLWALIYLLPGIFIGALSMHLSTKETTQFLLISVGVIVLLWFVYWIIQRFLTQIHSFQNWVFNRAWQFICNQRLFTPLSQLIKSKSSPSSATPLKQLCLLFFCVSLFLVILSNIMHQGALTYLNRPVFFLLQNLHNTISTNLLLGLTFLGDKKNIAVSIVLIFIYCLYKKRSADGWAFIITMAFSYAAVMVIKSMYFESRPDYFIFHNPSSSFPSGHATLSAVFFTLLYFLTKNQYSTKTKIAPSILALTLLAIGISRLYLGAHWLLDIIGGWILASVILLENRLIYNRLHKDTSQSRLSVCILIVLVTLPAALNSLLHFKQYKHGYTPHWSKTKLTFNQWWYYPDTLPLYRKDRLGHNSLPFNIQWSAPLNCIQSELSKEGWAPSKKPAGLNSMVKRIGSSNPQNHLPIFKWQHHNKPAVLFFTRPMKQSQQLELRLWKSQFYFRQTNNPIYLGTLNIHAPSRIHLKHHAHASIQVDTGSHFNLVINKTTQNQRINIISRKKKDTSDQSVLLILDHRRQATCETRG